MNRAQRREELKRALQAILQQAGDGTRLPPERELAKRLGVARETLRQVLGEMQDSGKVQRMRGAGTFVAGQSWLKPLLLRSFSEDMVERGLVPSSRILSNQVVCAQAKVSQMLKLAPGSEVLELRRLRLASGEPMALEATYLRPDLTPGLAPERLASESLYGLLRSQYGIQLRNAAQEIQATVLSEEEARWLDVAPFSPALLVERQVFATSGHVCEYSKSLYRADRYRFEVNVGRPVEGREAA